MYNIQTNSLAATGQLLQLAGIGFNRQALKDDLLGHPDYPSLFSVHHVLNKYGIENTPVEADAEHLDSLRQPFLAYLQLTGTGSDFAVVNSVQNGSVTYTNSKGKPETVKREAFLHQWKNIAVTVDAIKKTAAQTDALPALQRNRVFGYFATVAAVLLMFLATTAGAAAPLLYAPWLLLKAAGLAITVLLLVYEIDRQNETVKQFCSTGKTINCDAVLQSKGSKIGPFGWSELGFAYFAGSLVYLLIAGSSPAAYFPLAILSLLALPYTIYSIYYQYKVIKQWCRLCLAVQAMPGRAGYYCRGSPVYTNCLGNREYLFA